VAPQLSAGIFGSLGRFAKRAVGAVIGGIPVVGPAIGVAESILKTRGRKPQRPVGGRVAEPLLFGMNGGPGAPGAPSAAAAGVGTKIACPSGFHANKSGYHTMAGFVPKGSRCVRDRRRNPMNPRALDRAISRVDSGKRLQGKLATISTAKWTAAGKRKEHPHA
jgi:hypothetical protein